MLLHEAAVSAGAAANFNTLGRPTCMAVPAALASKDLPKVAEKARTIAAANAKLQEYHQAWRQQLTVIGADL
jgi:hypothetical protein